MKKLSVSLTAEQVKALDDRQDEADTTSRSAALREILDEYEEMHTEYEELRTECEELRTRLESRENRIDQLESQLAQRSTIEDKIEDLPDKIRDSETYQERRQRKIDQASLTQRMKWKVTGVPVDGDS